MSDATAVYHLVWCPNGKAPVVEEIDNIGSLISRVKEKHQEEEPGSVFVFYGQRLQTTKPPNPYLCLLNGVQIPLFTQPKPGEINVDGQTIEDDDAPDSDYSSLTQTGLAAVHAAQKAATPDEPSLPALPAPPEEEEEELPGD